MAEKIDPWEETTYYDTIKQNLKFEKVTTDGQEVNKPPTNGKFLKAVLLSDTHDQMQDAKIPDGDILIHAGDFTNAGEESMLKLFDEFLGTLSHEHKLVVAGNHELGFDDSENHANREPMWIGQGTKKGYELLKNGTWLQDKPIVIEGITFYGASWHPLQGYPFSLVRGPAMEAAWDRMPKKVDVLITHSPPLGYLDTFNAERWGCRHLLKKVKELKPMLHVFGHVHECYGVATDGDTIFVNAALCDKKNQLKNEPFVFYIPIPE